MNKMLCMGLTLGTFLFVGCAENSVGKDKGIKKTTAKEDVYGFVIAKSIKECAEHNITLNPKRIEVFMRRSPKKTIEQAAKETAQTPKKLCHLFAVETSLEKGKNVELFTSKIIDSCEKIGVTLGKEAIHSKVQRLPFFVIRKALAMKEKSTVEGCELMKK